MHNAAFARLGLDCAYLAFRVGRDGLAAAVAAMRALGALGFNLTMPHKEAVLPLLDEVSAEAAMIGSVNTVASREGRLVGHSTDGAGLARALREGGAGIEGRRIVLAGAGGAARAVAVRLAAEGAAAVTILNRGAERAIAVGEIVSRNFHSCSVAAGPLDDASLRRALDGADILVNCTSLGMRPDESSCVVADPRALRPGLVVADLVYEPRETELLRRAARAGCRVVGGLGMLLWQGAEAFRIWTGEEMPVDYVRKAVFGD